MRDKMKTDKQIAELKKETEDLTFMCSRRQETLNNTRTEYRECELDNIRLRGFLAAIADAENLEDARQWAQDAIDGVEL